MVDFSLTDEERQVRDTVRALIDREVVPLEPDVLRNERSGRPPLDEDVLAELRAKARRAGFWGVTAPEEYGGMGLGPAMAAILAMEIGRTFVPFDFGGNADNILYSCDERRRDRYLLPTIAGERRSCFLVDRDMGWRSEPIPTRGGWSPASIILDDVRVPDGNVLGKVGAGFTLALRWIGQGRLMIPARAVGSPERMLQMAIEGHARLGGLGE